MNPSFNVSASSTRQPTEVSIPARRRLRIPVPDTFGLGSRIQQTTLFTRARTIRSTHGGVLPQWLQGSRFTYRVAPLACTPAAASASTSAWTDPALLWYARPTTRPRFTTTAPTIGLGNVRPRPFRASRRVIFRYLASCAERRSICLHRTESVAKFSLFCGQVAAVRRVRSRFERDALHYPYTADFQSTDFLRIIRQQ